MGNVRKAYVTFTKAGDVRCVGQGFTVGNNWGYVIFHIVDRSCDLDKEAIETILEFCKEAERGESITIVPCDDRPEFTIEHNGDEQLTLTFLGIEALYQVWADDLAEVAKHMAARVEVATERARREKAGCPHHVGYKCGCQY